MQIINLTLNFAEIRFNSGDYPNGTVGDDVFPRTSPFLGDGITLNVDVVEFDTPPTQVAAILTGFRVWFQDPQDRELGLLEVRVGTPEQQTDVRYRIPVTFGLRDWGGDWDDEHGAQISIAVIGD